MPRLHRTSGFSLFLNPAPCEREAVAVRNPTSDTSSRRHMEQHAVLGRRVAASPRRPAHLRLRRGRLRFPRLLRGGVALPLRHLNRRLYWHQIQACWPTNDASTARRPKLNYAAMAVMAAVWESQAKVDATSLKPIKGPT